LRVTPIAGTTRDVLRERIALDGMPLHVLDTAGLREPTDAIEAEGIRRARAAIDRADRILFVVDGAADPRAEGYLRERASLPVHIPVTIVLNKTDIASSKAPHLAAADVIALSALTGQGVDELVAHLKASAGMESGADALSARARHLEALTRVEESLADAARQLTGRSTLELVAEELKRAQQVLGEIVGAQSSDELLGRIFSSFCIGK
jgi:tRNA modification GTPase